MVLEDYSDWAADYLAEEEVEEEEGNNAAGYY